MGIGTSEGVRRNKQMVGEKQDPCFVAVIEKRSSGLAHKEIN